MNTKWDPDILADVEYFSAEHFTNKKYVINGIRADHKVLEDYLICGEHFYIEQDKIFANKKYKTFIRFITPEAYPHSLWVGKIISIQR